MNDPLALIARIERDLAALRAMLPAEREAEEMPAAEEWLAPCQIADRLGIGEPHVRKLCSRALKLAHAGVRKDGGRWLATVEAIEALRRVSGAF